MKRPSCAAFTIAELLVSAVILTALTGLLLHATSQVGTVTQSTTGKIEQFREARQAFESITRRISEATLNTVLTSLKNNPDWKIRVEGFTDNVGAKEANEKLSADRAEAVANWLADHGIDRTRLSSKGYGESRPIASNKSEDGRAKNRRVELVRL